MPFFYDYSPLHILRDMTKTYNVRLFSHNPSYKKNFVYVTRMFGLFLSGIRSLKRLFDFARHYVFKHVTVGIFKSNVFVGDGTNGPAKYGALVFKRKTVKRNV